MDKARKMRKVHRMAFTRALNNLNTLFGAGSLENRQEVFVAFELLEGRMRDLDISSKNVVDYLLDADDSAEQDIQREYDEADEYKSKFIAAKLQVASYVEVRENQVLSTSAPTARLETKKTFKLPKIELAKFSGDIREWLQFWSLFRKIHDDVNIVNEDKFQYLIQAMVTGSRAADLVKSYPPTAENYNKVINSLKNRFGRDDLQIEVYVRELLQLVLQNALKSTKTLPLASLYDKIESHLRALESLGVTTEKCAAMLFPLVESCLPEEILRAWQRSSMRSAMAQSDEDSASQCKDRLMLLIKFLEGEVRNELRISMAVRGFDLTENKADSEKVTRLKSRPKEKDIPSATGLLTTKGKYNSCLFCKANHESVSCAMAKKLTLLERQECVKKEHACFNCLKVGHNFKQCRVQVNCGWCSRRHVLLMCPDIERKDKDTQKVDSKSSDAEKVNSECTLANVESDPEIMMQTLCVKLRNGNKEVIARAIIDTGSQRSYVSKAAASRLSYEPLDEQTMTHSLFGGQKSDAVRHTKYKIHLSSLDDSYCCNFTALDQDVICDNVPLLRIGEWTREFNALNIDISDRRSKNKAISVLIGADVAGKLFTGRIHALKSGLVAMETRLGWTVMGKVPGTESRVDATTTAISLFVNEDVVADLWSLDVLGIRDPIESKTQEQQEIEMTNTFLKNVNINEEGRYEVCLPWLENHPVLSDNKALANRRLQSTVKKLRNQKLYAEYDAVFNQWMAEGIIERVPAREEEDWGYYLPHRHVVKENSTTRMRPVFDASAKEREFPSLNECLHKGPNLIELITSVFMRFRKGEIGVVADIRKAFLQISIHKRDRNFLRFLWFDEQEKVSVFRHCRVVFGVSSSPFILSAIINLHLDNYINSVERSSKDSLLVEDIKQLRESFYVDNTVTSVNTRERLNTFMCHAKRVMSAAGFDLRGWEYSKDDFENHKTGVLGIIWDKKRDTLSISVPDFTELRNSKITKKIILSCAHRVFDPLGFICPVMLCPRILLQETWSENLTWDDEVPAELKRRFFEWVENLTDLNLVEIPRCFLGQISERDNISLHIFCDASKLAYATVIFIRIQNNDEVKVYFVQAKTRVAPFKKKSMDARASIPRLELLAATMGARLARGILETFSIKNRKVFYWTDSTTVLAWIQRECNWATFVNNRVKEIRALSEPTNWYHVQGRLNPADLPSRGCTSKQFLFSKWWEGPEWLREELDKMLTSKKLSSDEDEINKELKKSAKNKEEVYTLLTCKDDNERTFLDRFSSFKRMIRVIAWVKRFMFNGRNKKEFQRKGDLLFKEIQESRSLLLKMVQTECFGDEKDTRVRHLNAFKDKEGLIRLSSKIILREDDYCFKCPIVLPGKHRIVDLIVKEKHESSSHAGVEITLNALREEYWVLGGRRIIRSIIKKCIDCRRHDAKCLETTCAPLPLDRVRNAAVFEVIGVDFTGPIYLKNRQKAWVCLFTCAVFRAVHFELVTSLSTAAFLMVLRRFIARRGRPSVIYSDNGTNFVGLNNMFRQINLEKITRTLAVEQILWRFNPPTAAWWGGFWERLNGILKRLLRRTLKRSCLDYEEMSTVLLDCEAVINSRPITFLSECKQEVLPITPSMFLQEIKEIGVLDLDELEKCNLAKRYLYRQKIKQDLRKRFRIEYLGALIHRKTNTKSENIIKVGDIVLVGNDNVKRLDWPLARVKELIVGKDGDVRVVRLATANGELTRPIQRLYPLELKYGDIDTRVSDIITERCAKANVRDKLLPCLPNARVKGNKNDLDTTRNVTRRGRIVKPPRRLMID